MGTSEPVRAPPEVSRTRGHRLAKPRQIALSSNLGHSNPRSRARRWVLAARSWDFLSLPNFAPEVFVHARRHVFVVRMRDVFAYRLRVLEAVAANAAMPLVAGEDVRAPLGAFRVVFGIGHFRNYHSDRADYDSDDRASPAVCHGFREVAKSGGQPEPARPRLIRRLCVVPAFGLRPRARLRPRLCTKLVVRRQDQSASSERLYDHCNFRDGSKQSLHRLID